MANVNGTTIAYGEITILDLLDDATYIYYADDNSGGGASLSPTDKSYIGIYSGAALSTGQPNPGTTEYNNISDEIKWSKYVGEKGKDGVGIKSATITYQCGSSDTAPPSNEWYETVAAAKEAYPNAPFLWAKTYFVLDNDEERVSYSVAANGEDGLDGDRFLIEASQETILKFQTKSGLNFSPGSIDFVVYDLSVSSKKKIDLTENNYRIEIQLDNNEFITITPDDYIKDYDAISKQSYPSFKISSYYDYLSQNYNPESESESEVQDQINKAYLSLTTPSTYIRFVYVEDEKDKAFLPIEIRNGVSSEMAEFNITAAGFNAAVNSGKLEYTAEGLKITNGGLKIIGTSYELADVSGGFEDNVTYYEFINDAYVETTDTAPVADKSYYTLKSDSLLEYNSNQNRLTIQGDGTFSGNLQAAGGTFSGDISAASGTFSGSLKAENGTIGGFEIGENYIRSKDGGLELYSSNEEDGSESLIKIGNIEGKNAKITDYIQLGLNTKIYGSDSGDSKAVFEVNNGTSLFTISDSGRVFLGNPASDSYLVLDGSSQTIKSSTFAESGTGAGWSLSNGKSYFNNVVVRGKLESAVFETGKVSAVGGVLLIRPSTKIAAIDGTGITLEDATGFEGGTEADPEYYYISLQGGNLGDDAADAYYYSSTTTIDNNVITLTEELDSKYVGASIVSYGRKGSVGLGINGSTNEAELPASSFSVFEWAPDIDEESDELVYQKNYKIVLGKIPGESKDYGGLGGTYGLYADNAYLKGSLVTGVDKTYSGMKTSNGSPNSTHIFEEKGAPILLWAGATGTTEEEIKKAPFFVDQNGNLYAAAGQFEGTIITNAQITASVLKTAEIKGDEDTRALVVSDDVGTVFQTLNGQEIMTISADGVTIGDNYSLTMGKSTLSGTGSFSSSSLFLKNDTKSSVYISLPSLSGQNARGRIDFAADGRKEGSTNNTTYSIIDTTDGLSFNSASENKMVISSNNVSIETTAKFSGDLEYGEKLRYVQVKDSSNNVIGYDLYI